MSDIAVNFDHVWKKFKKGERYDSLRDWIPSMAKRVFTNNNRGELQEKEFWALRDVSFQVERGEALGIIGPNGAGKSTILKLLSRILRPTKGDIHVNGKLSALIEVGAGFHLDLTGRENIYLNAAIMGMHQKEIAAKFDQIVEFSEIEEFIDTPVKRYSSGMYARLGFSVAAHLDPDILLVDEVLSVGDLLFQQKCIDRMLNLKKQDVTIIFISHNLHSVQLLCNKAFLLRNGQIAASGTATEVVTNYLNSARASGNIKNLSSFISDSCILNSKGDITTLFNAGDKALLRFNIKVDRPLDEYMLGFLVHRSNDGFLVCDYNLPLSTIVEDDNKPGMEITASLGFRVNLLRGRYTVTFHLYHNPTQQHVFWGNHVLDFYVEERISWEGVSYLEPELLKEANKARARIKDAT